MPSKTKDIFETIRNPKTSWNGMVTLKVQEDEAETQAYETYWEDDYWLIRWAALNKAGKTIKQLNIESLIKKITDPNKHVSQTAASLFEKAIGEMPELAIQYCSIPTNNIRNICIKFMMHNIKTMKELICNTIKNSSWITANKLLFILFHQEKEKAEPVFLDSLFVKNTRRHAIMMLAIIQSKKAIPHFINLYSEPSLKRHIIQAINIMDKKVAYKELINALRIPEIEEKVSQICLKIGGPICATLIEQVHRNPKSIAPILKNMSIPSHLVKLLRNRIANQPDIKQHITLKEIKIAY